MPVLNLTLSVNPHDVLHSENQTLTISCETGEARPVPDIIWSVDGSPIVSASETCSLQDGNYKYSKRLCQIHVNTAKELNGKMYKCVIKENQTISQSYRLQVLCKLSFLLNYLPYIKSNTNKINNAYMRTL